MSIQRVVLGEIERAETQALRHLADASDMLAIVRLALPPIQMLTHFMAKGDHLDPRAARETKKSLNGMLDVIELICKRRGVSFPEVLAYLSPVEDLLIGLTIVAESGENTSDNCQS